MSIKNHSLTQPSACEVITRLSFVDNRSFALLRRWSPETGQPGPVEILIGEMVTVERLADIPLPQRTAGYGLAHDALALVPFRQIEERGYDCQDDGAPLQVLRIEEVHEFSLEDVLGALPTENVTLLDQGFDIDDETYEAIVNRIIHDEIAAGEGANFVIRRDFNAQLEDYTRQTALTLFKRLLTAERGAYWTFLVHSAPAKGGGTGRTIVGASPEAHIRLNNGEAVMNPISGTYRYPETGPDLAGLLDFLSDPKEVGELSMVLDEELKMMSAVGDGGGEVRGPYLREMAHLAHTEFEIRGRTSLDARDVLRETMFAATVTGSPLENACRVIRRYEPSGRGYYAGALALFSRGSDGAQQLDSPILIRTADIDAEGRLRMSVGATLVRNSDPRSEVAETWAKAAGILSALGVRNIRDSHPVTRGGARRTVAERPMATDRRVRKLLEDRRDSLAPFWLQPQGFMPPPRAEALIIDTGDAFTAMLAHVLRSAGLQPSIHSYSDDNLAGLVEVSPGLVVLGPGPGDPTDLEDKRMNKLENLAAALVRRAYSKALPVLGVCLGHQLIAQHLGFQLSRKPRPYQGMQEKIDFFGRVSKVGFYNSFAAYADDCVAGKFATQGIELSRSSDTGEIYAFRMPAIAGIQFHPESVLTMDGPAAMRDVLRQLLPERVYD